MMRRLRPRSCLDRVHLRRRPVPAVAAAASGATGPQLAWAAVEAGQVAAQPGRASQMPRYGRGENRVLAWGGSQTCGWEIESDGKISYYAGVLTYVIATSPFEIELRLPIKQKNKMRTTLDTLKINTTPWLVS